MKSIICGVFCESCVFVICVGLLYDKFWHEKTRVLLQPQFPSVLRGKRGYKEWRSKELGKTWHKCGERNTNELENWVYKIKHYKTKLCKSYCTQSYMRCLSIYAADLPRDMLSPARWSCTNWSWFEGNEKEYVEFLGPTQWTFTKPMIQW